MNGFHVEEQEFIVGGSQDNGWWVWGMKGRVMKGSNGT